jgi:hypothetical protein
MRSTAPSDSTSKNAESLGEPHCHGARVAPSLHTAPTARRQSRADMSYALTTVSEHAERAIARARFSTVGQRFLGQGYDCRTQPTATS